MTLLVTGFGAFPGAPRNPTERLMEALQGLRDKAGEPIAIRVLPVAWTASWPILKAAIEETGASRVLLFGLHGGASRLRIELCGRRERRLDRRDARGCLPDCRNETLPALLAARLPFAASAAALRRAGIDFEWSREAGGYLCNDTLYDLCLHAPSLGLSHFGFVHVPLTDDCIDAALACDDGAAHTFGSMAAEDVERAARLLIDVVAGDRPDEVQPAEWAATVVG